MLVDVRLLGGFEVSVDGRLIPPAEWRRRNAAAVVKVLALAPGHRLHRERLMDLLWPEAAADEAGPRLHKAAHYARTALGQRDGVVLREDLVALFPGADVVVDAWRFDAAAGAALEGGGIDGPVDYETAISLYRGELLPDDPYADWASDERARLAARYLQLLRASGRWEDVLRLDPADENAHVELLRADVLAGSRSRAMRRYETMEQVLMDELGVSPSPEAVALRERALALSSVGTKPTAAPLPRRLRIERPLGAVAGGLLEREEPLRDLAGALDDALTRERGSVVLIAGEAGCGKSSLLSTFLDAAPAQVDMVVGGCDDLLASRSLGPFRDMALTHPGVEAALDGAHGDDAFGGLLTVMARPTVMAIEDVHWADDATLDVIRYLSRRIAALPSLLVLTVRDDAIDPGHPLRRLLGGLSGPSVRRLSLPPLSAEAVAQLAQRVSVDVDAGELHRVTRGNAFFVTEVLAGGGAAVPPTVRDAVLARTSALAPDARSLIERLSVVPGRAERWLVRALGGGDDDVLMRVERSGVLTGTPSHVAFRHELARRAVETSLTDGERVRANADVAEALLSSPPVDPSRIVHHAERADRADLLVRYGPAAVDDAIRFGAHRQAAEMLRRLLGHDEAFAPGDVARMLNQLAYALYVLNEFDEALEHAERAVEVASAAADRSVLVDALSTLSRAVYWVRGPSHAREASQRAVDILSPGDDDVRLAGALTDLARGYSNLATVGIVAEPNPRALRVAEHAVDLAARLGRDDLRGQALTYLGSSRLALGDERGVADLADAVGLSVSDPRIENQVRVRVNAAGSSHRAGRLDEALRHVAAGLRLAPDVEFLSGEYRLRLTESVIHVNAGSWDQAIDELRALVATDRGPGAMRHLAASVLARVLARRGAPGSQVLLDGPLADPVTHGDVFVAGPLAIAQVELQWLAGVTAPMPVIATEALELAEHAGYPAVHAELCSYLRRAGHQVASLDDPPGPWAHVLAGRWAEAAGAWADLGDRYERAVVLALHGDPVASLEGLAELDKLGATATIDRIEASPG